MAKSDPIEGDAQWHSQEVEVGEKVAFQKATNNSSVSVIQALLPDCWHVKLTVFNNNNNNLFTLAQWHNQSKRATWATDQQHQCHIECFINLKAGQPGQSKGQPGHCPQLPRCSYVTAQTFTNCPT